MRHIIGLLSLLLYLSACSSDLNKANDGFSKKYRKDIEKINKERTPDKKSKEEKMFSRPPTKEEVVQDIASKIEYYPYVDIAKLGDAPQNILPNRETYEQSQSAPSNTLPATIFDINYNLTLSPPFHRIGAEFDVISVPKSDAFGVSTELADKSYLRVGANSLQQAVDSISATKSDVDVEITKMLVQEKKKLQRQEKARQIFGEQNAPTTSTKTTSQENKPKIQAPQNSTQVPTSGFIRSVIKNNDSSTQK